MTRYCLTFIALLFPLFTLAQQTINGIVYDETSHEALPFVNIVANDNLSGTTSDIDGKFTIESPVDIKVLKFSYVGYEPLQIQIEPDQQDLEVFLTKTSYNLQEFTVLPGENPAHRIIKKVVENRKLNNPEKACSFQYISYNKMVFTANLDSAIVNDPDQMNQLDTSDQAMFEYLEKQHIFLTEAVTRRKFMPPDRTDEEIIASRVSGFKMPTFSLLASQMQSFSFYKELITLADFTYVNPISKGSTRKYLFQIEDTTWSAKDTVFVISYRPKKGKKFEGLKGLLYINTNGYALQNVLAEPVEREDGLGVKIQQQYANIDGQWFPVQLNTTLVFHNAQIQNYDLLAIGRSYLRDIEINPSFKRREFDNIVVEMDPLHVDEAEVILKKYRVDSLTARDKNTYHLIDSVGEEKNLDARIKLFEALASGKLPYKWMSFDLDRLLTFNDYEGFRLGIGLHTNDKISRHFNVGGYYAYGFKDKRHKWGADLNVFISRKREITLNAGYSEDVMETGGVKFFEDRLSDFTESYRKVYINRMEWGQTLQSWLSFRTLQHFKVYLFGAAETRHTPTEYLFFQPFGDGEFGTRVYNFTTAGASIRFGFKEKFAKTGWTKLSLGSKYPIVWAKITKGFDNLYDGEFDFMRYDIKLEKTFNIKSLGKPTFRIMAGYVDGNLPWTMLYTGRGTFQNWNIAVLNSFETMRRNEFISDQYVSLFFNHNFGNLIFNGEKFKPEVQLVTNVGWGKLSNTEAHRNIDFKTMEDGYIESGLFLNNLLVFNFSGIGIGAYYRYGANRFEETTDNIAVKLSVGFKF